MTTVAINETYVLVEEDEDTLLVLVSATAVVGGTVVSLNGVAQALLDINTAPVTAADIGAIPTTAKGAHNGVATLDTNGSIPVAQLGLLTAHTANTSNPHSVTKAQVGLGNADNTSDANKPVSTAQQTAISAETSTRAAADTALDGRVTVVEAALATVSTNYRTTDYVLALSDGNKIVEMDSASQRFVTIPANADVAFPIGTLIEITRIGVGLVTIAAPRNLIANPSVEVDLTNWTVSGNATIVRTAAAALTGSWGARATNTTGVGPQQIFYSNGQLGLTQLGLVVGDVVSAGAFFRTSVAGGAQLNMQFYAGGVLVSGFQSGLTNDGGFHAIVNKTIPATTDNIHLFVQCQGTPVIGDTLDVDGFMLTKTATLPAYSDAGVTLRNAGTGTTISSQYASAVLRKRATDEWIIGGSLS